MAHAMFVHLYVYIWFLAHDSISGVMASSSRVLVESELLCYVQNNFGKFPKAAVVQTIVGFYNKDECWQRRKTSLFEFVNTLQEKPDGVSRQI